MSWLDHVIATPVVGCGLKPASFQSSQDYIAALRPLLKKWGATADLSVTAEKPFNLTIGRKDGFAYAMEPAKFVVQFRYLYQLERQPNKVGPAIIDDPEIKKYTSLLEDAGDEFCEVFDLIAGSEVRHLLRLGIVATCRLDAKELPPGVDLFVKHLGRPWGSEPLEKCEATLLGTISQDEKIRDRCHHQIDMSVDHKNEVGLVLDWQRLYLTEPQIVKGKFLREQVKKCSADALEYFERFGKGDLKYGDLD